MASCILEGLTFDEATLEVVISNLKIRDPTLYNILISIDDDVERSKFIERMMTIGFEVIQMMDQTSRVDYVKNEFTCMKEAFDQSFIDVFAEKGKLSNLLDDYFGKKGEVTDLLSRHFGEEGSVLCNILNYSDEQTPLGKFRKDLHSMLDMNSEDTSFYKLKKSIEDGLADVSRKIELRDEVNKAKTEERAKGTAKGRDFQTFLTDITDQIAKPLEDTVSFVGDDVGLVNKVGDILILINPKYTKGVKKSIIIEAKNSKINITGKKSFLKELDAAIENRSSIIAIGAVHESKIDESIGEYRRFSDNKIVVKIPEDSYPLALEIAYKVARAEIIAKTLSDENGFDATIVLEKIGEINSKLELMRATKRSLTTAKKNIDTAYNNLEEMEKDITECTNSLSRLLQSGE